MFANKHLTGDLRRESPGWGRLSGAAISSGKPDRWSGYPRRWVRGKLHGYEMSLDIGCWPNRTTFFLERWSNLPVQLLIQAILRPGDTMLDIANENEHGND
jgi:hypothetical protein